MQGAHLNSGIEGQDVQHSETLFSQNYLRFKGQMIWQQTDRQTKTQTDSTRKECG